MNEIFLSLSHVFAQILFLSNADGPPFFAVTFQLYFTFPILIDISYTVIVAFYLLLDYSSTLSAMRIQIADELIDHSFSLPFRTSHPTSGKLQVHA